MRITRNSMLVGIIALLALVAASCGDDDEGSGDADTNTEQSEGAATDSDSGDVTDATTESIDPEDLEVEVFGEGTATISLDNGESFESPVACVLEEQVAADQVILFTATALDGSVDVTQFGSDGPNPDVASVGIYDPETYEPIWTADSTTGDLTLSLDGSTIVGAGSFVAGDGLDAGATETVPGTIQVEC